MEERTADHMFPELLGVEVTATTEEIKKAYRKVRRHCILPLAKPVMLIYHYSLLSSTIPTRFPRISEKSPNTCSSA